MTFQDIIYVLAVAQESSFSKAAAKLYVSQSAISQSISKVEKELGEPLFLRSNKQVLPTKTGLLFVEKAEPMVQMYHQFLGEMKSIGQSNKKKIRVGVSSFYSRYLAFQKQMTSSLSTSNFELEVVEDLAAVIEQLTVSGKLDFCFTRAPVQHSKLQCEPLFIEKLFLIAPANHPICQKYPASEENPYPSVNLKEVRNSSFVMINNPSITPQCMQLCRNAGFTPHITATTSVWERVQNNVINLEVVGFISCVFAKPPTDPSCERYFRIDSPLASLENVVAYVSTENLSKNCREYIDAFRNFLVPLIPQ